MQELEESRNMKSYSRTRRIKKNERLIKNLNDLKERKIMQELEESRNMKNNSRTRRI